RRIPAQSVCSASPGEKSLGHPPTRSLRPRIGRQSVLHWEEKQALAEAKASDERWHLRKDGTRFWSNGFLMPMHDANGNSVGFVKILRDETESQQARETLERSREQLVDALKEKDRAWKEAETASKAKD